MTGSKEEEEWCLINRGLERTVKDGWSSLLRMETKLGLEAMIMMVDICKGQSSSCIDNRVSVLFI